MRKRVDYLPLCERALTMLGVVDKALEYVKRYELHSSMEADLDGIDELLHVAPIQLEENALANLHRLLFESLMEQIALIEDKLREMLMSSGDIMKKLGRLPPEEREEICSILDIEYVPVADRMSDELKDILFKLLEKMDTLNQFSSKYYSFEEERFVEYEDEVNPGE